MNRSPGVLALALVSFGAACASTAPAASNTAPTATSAGAPAGGPAAQREAEHAAARDGCVRAIRSPNEQAYARNVRSSGIGAEGAPAEARFVFDFVNDDLASVCECTFAAFGGWVVMTAEAARVGQSVDVWMQQQLADPAAKARAEQCAAKVENLKASLQEHLPEVKAFQQRWRDAHPADAARFECRSRQAEGKFNLKSLYVAEESHRAEYDAYDADFAKVQFEPRAGAGGKTHYRYEIALSSPTAFVARAIGIGEMAGDEWTITENNDLKNVTSVCPADE